MAYDHETTLDRVGWRILRELQEDGRIPLAELGRRVNLSAPAVAERVRRMEEAGVIAGYRAEVRPEKVGLPILAFVRFAETEYASGMRAASMFEELPEVLECHRLTGDDSFLMKVAVSSVSHLEELVDRLAPRGRLTTSIVLSSPVERRAVGPPAERRGRGANGSASTDRQEADPSP